MPDVIYADFTCPACYLAGLRADRRLAEGLPAPDWRAVEHRPRLPFPGVRLGAGARAVRDRELAEVRLLLEEGEELPESVPGLLPNTAAAVAAYAEAYEAGVADLVRPLIFRAYWVEGLDIGDPEVLRRLLPDAFRQGRRTSDCIRDFGYAVTSQHTTITYAAGRRVRAWEQEWLTRGAGTGLTLVTDAGTLTGERALRYLAEPAPATASAAPADALDLADALALAGRR